MIYAVIFKAVFNSREQAEQAYHALRAKASEDYLGVVDIEDAGCYTPRLVEKQQQRR